MIEKFLQRGGPEVFAVFLLILAVLALIFLFATLAVDIYEYRRKRNRMRQLERAKDRPDYVPFDKRA